MNPYNANSFESDASTSDSRRTWIALLPFIIAVPGLIAAAVLSAWSPFSREFTSTAWRIVSAILFLDIPVCVFVAIQWLRRGEPPELSLYPLVPSREEREFYRRLREREPLDDDRFYDTYYSDSEISKDTTVRLRRFFESQFGLPFAKLHPGDNLFHAGDDFDWGDVVD